MFLLNCVWKIYNVFLQITYINTLDTILKANMAWKYTSLNCRSAFCMGWLSNYVFICSDTKFSIYHMQYLKKNVNYWKDSTFFIARSSDLNYLHKYSDIIRWLTKLEGLALYAGQLIAPADECEELQPLTKDFCPSGQN